MPKLFQCHKNMPSPPQPLDPFTARRAGNPTDDGRGSSLNARANRFRILSAARCSRRKKCHSRQETRLLSCLASPGHVSRRFLEILPAQLAWLTQPREIISAPYCKELKLKDRGRSHASRWSDGRARRGRRGRRGMERWSKVPLSVGPHLIPYRHSHKRRVTGGLACKPLQKYFFTLALTIASLSHWGQCCLRVAASPCLPNSPITQLSPYFTQNPCISYSSHLAGKILLMAPTGMVLSTT